jgi:hypothetical protein
MEGCAVVDTVGDDRERLDRSGVCALGQPLDAGAGAELAARFGFYEARTGRRALLNTSLNGAGEPIAGSENDAVAFFASHRALGGLSGR